jgi:hypothetical protein
MQLCSCILLKHDAQFLFYLCRDRFLDLTTNKIFFFVEKKILKKFLLQIQKIFFSRNLKKKVQDYILQTIHVRSFLCIKDFIALSLVSISGNKIWHKSKLCRWLDESLLIEFDADGNFYVHHANHVIDPNRAYESNLSHNALHSGLHFIVIRKRLMENPRFLLAFNLAYCEEESRWCFDYLWQRDKFVRNLGSMNRLSRFIS